MPISTKRLMERERQRIIAWCDRRDAVFSLYRRHYWNKFRDAWTEFTGEMRCILRSF